MTTILGISAYYHDAAAALLVDGRIVAAAEEERFTRKKHDSDFPLSAVAWCLEHAGLDAAQLDYVGFYDKPYLKFDRLLESHLARAPRGFRAFSAAMPAWLKQKLWLPREMRRALGGAYRKAFVFTEHHEAHAAAAFFPSPFEEAAILTMDGVGEWATASFGVGRGNRVELLRELRFPHSLGLLYTAFTTYAGFRANSDEYKLMGLAPYGAPRFYDLILEKLIDLKPDGSFRMDLAYFDYVAGLRMTNERFDALFGAPARQPETPIEQHTKDVAASIQKVAEEIVLRAARHVHARTAMRDLCLSGGVALNCVANGRLLREGPFERIWIQPAAGDSGSALGVAQFIWYQLLSRPRVAHAEDDQQGSLLGPSFRPEEIAAVLEETRTPCRRIDDEAERAEAVADLLADGKVVAWFQGPMEFGPRALGSRSILADPRRPDMQSVINRKVKFREGFRPFAPAVLREAVSEYFDCAASLESPYMLIVSPVKRETLPAVTHVDGSARIQTVDAARHGSFRRLLEAFQRKTGCGVLVNTSFNLSWEPIVCTPRQAYDSFMSSELDALCIGPFLIEKTAQKAWVAPGSTTRPDDGVVALLASPCCGAEMRRRGDALECERCQHAFPVTGGIARLFWPHEAMGDASDVTELVKSFYEETPFPNYEDHESVRSLVDRSRRGAYAAMLGRSIPYNSSVLEVGCGTGQLSNFLGIACRTVVGTDLCSNSLALGESFRAQHGLDRVHFAQMNLFRPAFKPASFDVLLCNGVLHHTSDPFGGFRGLVPLVRPGGILVIGLYHRWGRTMTSLRRQLFKLTGGRGRWLDPTLRGLGASRSSAEKERAWFSDQYRHPHESTHTVGEVMEWFERTDVDLLRGLPSLTLDAPPPAPDGLFAREPAGSGFARSLAQAAQIVTGNREGGFFVTIGRRKL